MYQSSDEVGNRRAGIKNKRENCKGKPGAKHKNEWFPKWGPFRKRPDEDGAELHYYFALRCVVCKRVHGCKEQRQVAPLQSHD